MLPRWRTPPSEASVGLSESAYSQPSPTRNSALRPFSAFVSSQFARASRESRGATIESSSATTSADPPVIPPIQIDSQNVEVEESDASGPSGSFQFNVAPGISPSSDAQRPLSALTFSSSAESAPVQAPARVLDYGGNVSLDSPFAATGRRFGSGRRGRQGSSGSPHSQRSTQSVRSYEERSRNSRPANAGRRRGPRWIPKHSKGRVFFPAMKHAAVRTKFFHALVSGALLIIILIVFLALLSSDAAFTQEFRIIAILFMLVFVVLFAHSIIRFFMLLHRLKKRSGLSRHPSLDNYDSYARPTHPIPVILARDEELGISGTPSTETAEIPKPPPPPPPAYGLWRGSVRVDPNLIHWRRVDDSQTNGRPLSVETVHQPPEYPENAESPDVVIERQMAQERADVARARSEAAQWRPSVLLSPGTLPREQAVGHEGGRF